MKNLRIRRLIRNTSLGWFLLIIVLLIILLATLRLWAIAENIEKSVPLSDTTNKTEVQKIILHISPDDVFKLTNIEREKSGLKPLTRSVELDTAALERAKVIIETNDWSHEASKSGETYLKAIGETNYINTVYGENLAQGQTSADEVVTQWMNSQEHKENILSPGYQDVGIATYTGNLFGSTTIVTVQLFGGYVPPNYKKADIDSWKEVLSEMKKIQPGWRELKSKSYSNFYNKHKNEIDRINHLIDIRIANATSIVTRMSANQWLIESELTMISGDVDLSNEINYLAKRLNSY